LSEEWERVNRDMDNTAQFFSPACPESRLLSVIATIRAAGMAGIIAIMRKTRFCAVRRLPNESCNTLYRNGLHKQSPLLRDLLGSWRKCGTVAAIRTLKPKCRWCLENLLAAAFAALCISRFDCNRADLTLLRGRPSFPRDQSRQPLQAEQACCAFSELQELSCGSNSGDEPIRCDEVRDDA